MTSPYSTVEARAAVAHTTDSFKAIKHFKDDTFDVTITDPPFPGHVHNNLCSGSLVGTKRVPKYTLDFDPLTEYTWLKDLVRVTKRWVVVHCSLEDFGRFEMAVGRPTYVRSCIWYKPNSMGQLTRDRPATAYEGIALLHAPEIKKRWNGKGSYGIWKCNGTRGVKGRHPNQKPDDLCRKLVHLFSDPGELVFDPFCGSASVGKACLELGRRYVGWDSSWDWVQSATKRLSDVEVNPDLDTSDLCLMREPKPKTFKKGSLERPFVYVGSDS